MKHSILILLSLLPALVFGQLFNYSKIRAKSIDSLRIIDKSKFVEYSYPIFVSSDYFPNQKQFSLAQPIIYNRNLNGFKTETSFYFSLPDSVVRLIEYQWEGGEKSTDSQFNQIVLANKKAISDHFKFQPQEFPETETKAAKSIWQNESVFVEVLVMPGLQRTRVLVSWK